MTLRRILLAATALGTLAAPATASAAVTLQPDAAPAGTFTRLDVRVPTERGVATRRVVLDLPSGFVFASYQPVAGWKVRMTTHHLTTPVSTESGQVDSEVSRISWTARRTAEGIPPGGFQDFGLSVRVPAGKVGSRLTFDASQTYADGEVVKFSGDPGSTDAAPQVTLTNTPDPATAAIQAATPKVAPKAAPASDLPSQGLVLGALVAGGLGMLMGMAGWIAGARRMA
jgi:uncharacterized protein YcnI